jgi:hypothetical protein
MPVPAPWTAIRDTPNKSVRQNVARVGVVLHHAAMTSLTGLRQMEVFGSKEVSSTAICKDDDLELVVPDDRYRPWSLSNAYGDSAYRSIETCNESTNGWTISDKSHEKVAQAVAYWAQTDGFWPHRDGDSKTWTVRGHREMAELGLSYATACPGGLDLDRVTRRAQQLLTTTAATKVVPIIPRGKDSTMGPFYALHEPSGAIGLFKGYEVVLFGSVNDYNAHRASIIKANEFNTSTGQTEFVQPVPPDINGANAKANFVNFTQDEWAIEVAVHGGYRK